MSSQSLVLGAASLCASEASCNALHKRAACLISQGLAGHPHQAKQPTLRSQQPVAAVSSAHNELAGAWLWHAWSALATRGGLPVRSEAHLFPSSPVIGSVAHIPGRLHVEVLTAGQDKVVPMPAYTVLICRAPSQQEGPRQAQKDRWASSGAASGGEQARPAAYGRAARRPAASAAPAAAGNGRPPALEDFPALGGPGRQAASPQAAAGAQRGRKAGQAQAEVPQVVGGPSEALKAANKVRAAKQGRHRFEVCQIVNRIVDGLSEALKPAIKMRAGRQGRCRWRNVRWLSASLERMNTANQVQL